MRNQIVKHESDSSELQAAQWGGERRRRRSPHGPPDPFLWNFPEQVVPKHTVRRTANPSDSHLRYDFEGSLTWDRSRTRNDFTAVTVVLFVLVALTMHEFSLYGQVSQDDHHRTIQQLAGVTRMQPKPVKELHLVFKSQSPPGLANVPSTGGSQTASAQEAQRVGKMLSSGLYYIQLVGNIEMRNTKAANGDVTFTNGHQEPDPNLSVKWYLEFKDIPEAGKQPVSSRLVSKTEIIDGDVMAFMQQFGYEYGMALSHERINADHCCRYISRYLVVGDKFFDQETTLFLHQVLQTPQVEKPPQASDLSFLSSTEDLKPLDASGGYVLQAFIDAADGNNLELKDRGTKQLLAMRETLKQAVVLTPGDRLALDTRLIVNRRV